MPHTFYYCVKMVHVVKWWMKNTDVTYSDIKILYFMPTATCPSLKKKKGFGLYLKEFELERKTTLVEE